MKKIASSYSPALALLMLVLLSLGANVRAEQAPIDGQYYNVENHQISLHSEGSQCVLQHQATDSIGVIGPSQRLVLALRPPCYFMLWQAPPPKKARGSISGGIAVGKQGGVLAWRYASAKNAIVLAIIGDPDEDASFPSYAPSIALGYHCGISMQGVLLRKNNVSLSTVRKNNAVYCVETGVDEKNYWLLAHP